MCSRLASLPLLLLLLALSGRAQEPSEPTGLDQVRQLAALSGGTERWGKASQVVVWDSTINRIEDSGLGHTYKHRIIKVLRPTATRALASLRFDYDPASNMVDVTMARIIRADGKVEMIGAERILDLPQPQTMIIWGPRMKVIDCGRLQPGDILEYKLYQKGFMIAYLGGPEEGDERFIPPMRGHFYDTLVFASPSPVCCSYYRVQLPRNKPLRFKVYNGQVASACDYTDQHLVYSFWKRDMAPFHKEPAAVAESDQCPKVVMATTRTWEEKSRWFWRVQEERKIFANAPRADGLPGGPEEVEAIKKVVEKLTAGKSREEQIRALNHWAADRIRYMGITMGKGEGYTIHPGVMNMHDRCGVCKDKAGMLTTMLRVAGFEAYCGMTMAGSRVEEIPADQFNHCITAVREPDGSLRLLDPTWIPLSMEMWSSAESEQNYLIGTEKGETLMITPLPPPEHNRLFINVKTDLDDQGGLTADFSLYGTNYADQRMRRHLYEIPQRLVPSRFSQWAWQVAPGSRVTERRYSPDAMTDYSAPVNVGFKLSTDSYGFTGDRVRLFVPLTSRQVVGGRMAPFLNVPLTGKRTQDMLLWCNRSLKMRETVSLPGGWRVKRLPAPVQLDGPAMRLSRTVRQTDGGRQLICELEIALKLRTIKVGDFEQFKTVVQSYLGLADDPVVLER